MAKRTSVWRNSFKTFRQFGETIIMVLIANIRSDVIQILVRLYFISYATVTATFRITKMTTRSLATTSLARRHIRQGLSFALYDGSHASKYNCGNSCVFLTGWHTTRAKVGIPVGQSKHVAVTNPLIGWAREGFPEFGFVVHASHC